jgi:enamine deaminase RidA (YjgF/YER057c/UK114 family)
MVLRKVDARTKWGDTVGYSRAVRVGNVISVSGTAASDKDGRVVGAGDPYAQTVFIIKKIGEALRELDAELSDVVRTRIFTTDIGRWQEIAKAHAEFFGGTKPASSMIQISRLIDPAMIVEIEAEAILE